jgi:hypothetical protein
LGKPLWTGNSRGGTNVLLKKENQSMQQPPPVPEEPRPDIPQPSQPGQPGPVPPETPTRTPDIDVPSPGTQPTGPVSPIG